MKRLTTPVIALALFLAACGDSPDSDTETVFPDPAVAYLQTALTSLGYDVGAVDGIYGTVTTEALAAFQGDNGIEGSGDLDAATVAALESQASETEHLLVESVQTQLVELGVYPGPVDGEWGPDTESAVSEFQLRASLDATGILDSETFSELSSAYHSEVVDSHTSAAASSGVGGEIPQERSTVPEGSEDQYLQQGDSGDDVRQLQESLAALGYRPGTADGDFGAHTTSAVLAFQKREGLQRDGIVGPEVLERLDNPQGAGPQSSDTGPRVEVDLDRQILFVIDSSGGVTTLNTSTGSGKEFQSAEPGKGIVVAHTPTGEFEILRVIDGLREAPLGTLYRPMYFTSEGGFAIHGNPNVPAYPASHGCARLANYDMDFLWDSGLEVGDAVWVYGDNPPAPDNAAGGF